MEPSKLPVISKRFWSLLKAALFLLKQGISKRKLMLDLNLKLKRGKIAAARKAALHNLTTPSSAAVAPASAVEFPDDPSDAFEFSCDNSPAHRPPRSPTPNYLSIVAKKLSKHLRREEIALPPAAEEAVCSAAASPALPGFGSTPVVRQLRVTDSPFQSRDGDEFYGDSCHVDEAAELFIREFYEKLRRQSSE